MAEFIAETIGQLGYLGVALLMFIETVIPPIPSELIMPLVGLAAARGEITLVGAIVAATLGSTIGATAWYGFARAIGRQRLLRFAARYGRWVGLNEEITDRAATWFAERGGWAIFVGRILPAARVYISIPAGLAHMPMGRFLIFTVAGFTLWYGFLGVAGFAFAHWINPTVLTWGTIIGVLVVLPLLHLLRKR